jgi:hypothetical protein
MIFTPHPAETAPRDGRAIRGWFRGEGDNRMIAVAWLDEAGAWVTLTGDVVPSTLALYSWGDD